MSTLHIDYHAVLAAFHENTTTCPLCTTIVASETAFWDSTLYGAVGTEGFQDRFLGTNGFCPRHARDLGQRRDGVAVTMLYAPLLRHRQNWLREEERGRFARSLRRTVAFFFAGRRRNGRRSPAERRGSTARDEDCLLCERINRWTESFLANLLRHQNVPELRNATENGRGLCVRHYRAMTYLGGVISIIPGRRVPAPALWLREFHHRIWDEVSAAAEHEAIRRGGTAWRELLRTMEGDAAVRG